MAELELAQLKILHKELKHAIQEEKIEKANAINLLQFNKDYLKNKQNNLNG